MCFGRGGAGKWLGGLGLWAIPSGGVPSSGQGRMNSLLRCNNHTKSAFAPPSRTGLQLHNRGCRARRQGLPPPPFPAGSSRRGEARVEGHRAASAGRLLSGGRPAARETLSCIAPSSASHPSSPSSFGGDGWEMPAGRGRTRGPASEHRGAAARATAPPTSVIHRAARSWPPPSPAPARRGGSRSAASLRHVGFAKRLGTGR
jgi:hypothetical protein